MTRRGRRNDRASDPYALYRGYNFIPNENIQSDNCPRVFFKVYLFRCPCNHVKFASWESPLSGAEDGETCDNPACSGNQPIMPYSHVIGKTPCQSPDDRAFGSFKCHKCPRMWFSAHSWANAFQKCENCNIKIYPYDQDNLGRPVKNKKKNHQTALCGECIRTGTDCSKVRKDGSNRRRRFRRRLRRGGGGGGGGGDAGNNNAFNLNALNAALPDV